MRTADRYRIFARQTRGVSPCFERWALGVADDEEVLAHIDTLPMSKRQPNLVFAAARWLGAEAGLYSQLRDTLIERWDDVRSLALRRSTQTNEAGRCASMLPLLSALPPPLALLEVGASAGLCLYPDRYSYRYSDGTRLDPADGPSAVVIDCEVRGDPPRAAALPRVVWRAGIDLDPIDVRDDAGIAWLETLIWPEHDDRRSRLHHAVAVARRDPPVLVQGDLNSGLTELADRAPTGATLVVFHTAVLTYLAPADRQRFVRSVSALPGHWISNEGAEVLPDVATTAPRSTSYDGEHFVLGLDGQAKAWTGPHGQTLDWL